VLSLKGERKSEDAIACHATPGGSGVFTRVQEVPICKAFGSCAFTADHRSSKYLLTETLTFCLGQLIASTADSHSDTAIILPRWREGHYWTSKQRCSARVVGGIRPSWWPSTRWFT